MDTEDITLALVLGAGVVVLGLLVAGAIAEGKRPGFELKKDDWACSREHTETTYILMDFSGGKGVLTPMPHFTQVCDQWTRK